MKKYLPLIALLFTLLIAAGLKNILSPANYHPFIVMNVPGGLKTTFLQEGLTDNECESTLSALLNTIQSSCPTCVHEKKKCVQELTQRQLKWLSTSPIAIPSIRWNNGIILFESNDPEIALLACQRHEDNSASSAGLPRARCFPANTERPLVEKDWNDILRARSTAIALSLSAIFLVLGFYLVINQSGAQFGQMLYARPRRHKKLLMLSSDLVSLELALWLSFSLRLEQIYQPRGDALFLFALVPLIAFPIFFRFGLYRTIIRYLGMPAMLTMAKAVVVYSALMIIFQYLLELGGIPRSVPLINTLLSLLFIGSSRVMARYWLRRAHFFARNDRYSSDNVVIYGAGEAGVQLAGALTLNSEMRPLAFVDDDTSIQGHQIGGLIVHSPKDLPNLIAENQVKAILLAIPSADRLRRNEIIRQLEPLPVHVKTIPRLTELAQGKVNTDDLREVDIEDLLGRDPVPPNPDLLGANISGKSVMVTGAGGSIGSELCRQILALSPSRLVLFELNEFALYSIEQELINQNVMSGREFPAQVIAILGSVSDANRLGNTIKAFGVNTIFHAAAYKHVPMVEKNPIEGVRNNIIGTYTAARMAHEHHVDTFVLISTDKAVRPTNTMGASKRFAEIILQAYAKKYPEETNFTIVRFGNVLGSSGSVVPLFRNQIKKGGPITVTDPRIIRYFMTIPEAAQLVIQAGAMGKDGDVFVLDMGEPVKILDVAKRMISLSGLREKDKDNPNGDIEIIFSGLRPGEKLYEELLIGDNVSTTPHPRIMRANESTLPWNTVIPLLCAFLDACDRGDSAEIRKLLLSSVEGYMPQCGNEDLLLIDALD